MINIPINPKKSYSSCQRCQKKGSHIGYIYQGIHFSEKFKCNKCKTINIYDLPIGHSLDYGFKYNQSDENAWTRREGARSWFVTPYISALKNPNNKKIKIKIKKYSKVKKPLIINCIDYLYGHGLLKLLNLDRHLRKHKRYDLVLIIPKSLEWLVPNGVAEVILVPISLSESRNYYPSLDEQINKYISKYNHIFLSKTFAHPPIQDISKFTGQKSFKEIKNPRITFIWREDRPWINNIYLVYLSKKFGLIKILNYIQFFKVLAIFNLFKINKLNHMLIFTVAGFGKSFTFPKWIDDQRVEGFTKSLERKLCRIYSQSEIVIGVHGSNMLLPSAHAKMVLNLLPDDRLGNFAQDMIYELKRNQDPRIRAFMYRYAFLNTSIITLSKTILSMLKYSTEAERMYSVK